MFARPVQYTLAHLFCTAALTGCGLLECKCSTREATASKPRQNSLTNATYPPVPPFPSSGYPQRMHQEKSIPLRKPPREVLEVWDRHLKNRKSVGCGARQRGPSWTGWILCETLTREGWRPRGTGSACRCVSVWWPCGCVDIIGIVGAVPEPNPIVLSGLARKLHEAGRLRNTRTTMYQRWKPKKALACSRRGPKPPRDSRFCVIRG